MEQILYWIETPQQETCDALGGKNDKIAIGTWFKFLPNMTITSLMYFFL